MKYLSSILIILTLVIFNGCSGDEKLIDYSNDTRQFLISLDSEPSALMLIEYPSGKILNNDIYFDKNGVKLQSPPTKIVEYRNNLYLIMPSANKIEIINKLTYESIAVLDFTAENIKPTDICFANATDAYISYGNQPYVGLLDLTNFQIARKIDVGKDPVAITCAGNQIFVANQGDNTVSIIDSRTHQEEAVLQVGIAPTYIDVTPDWKRALVVSLGAGKLTTKENKSPATTTLIDVETKTILKTIQIAPTGLDPNLPVPNSLTITNKYYGFIPFDLFYIRYDVHSGERFNLIDKKNYQSVFYNYKKDELVLFKFNGDNTDIITAEPSTSRYRKTITLPYKIKTVIPY